MKLGKIIERQFYHITFIRTFKREDFQMSKGLSLFKLQITLLVSSVVKNIKL